MPIDLRRPIEPYDVLQNIEMKIRGEEVRKIEDLANNS